MLAYHSHNADSASWINVEPVTSLKELIEYYSTMRPVSATTKVTNQTSVDEGEDLCKLQAMNESGHFAWAFVGLVLFKRIVI